MADTGNSGPAGRDLLPQDWLTSLSRTFWLSGDPVRGQG